MLINVVHLPVFSREIHGNSINERLVDRLCVTPASVASSTDSAAAWQSVAWQDIQVGDVVRVHVNEYFPADLLMLSGADADGRCFVETANLDGMRQVPLQPTLLPL